MKLKIYSIASRYAFSLDRFFSPIHFFLCPNIKSSYKYAWEAYRDAKKLASKLPTQILAMEKLSREDEGSSGVSEISAEEMLFSSNDQVLKLMVEKSKGFKDEEDRKAVYEEIKSIVTGILKMKEDLEDGKHKDEIDRQLGGFKKLVREKFSDLLSKDKMELEKEEKEKENPPISHEMEELGGLEGLESLTAPIEGDPGVPGVPPIGQPMAMSQFTNIMMRTSSLDSDVKESLMDEYAIRACRAIEKKHPDAICKIDSNRGVLKITKATGEPLLKVCVNDNMNVYSIEPEGDLSKAYPLYSIEFYQKYWKPMVEKIGHYFISDMDTLMCPSKSALPDIPNQFPSSVQMIGWQVKSSKENPFELRFCGDKPSWGFKKSELKKEAATRPSKYTEDDFLRNQPSRVQCIDPKLKSLEGKIGEVVQVVPLEDHIELDVNFGRVVVRLTESQIELLTNDIPTAS